MIRWLERHNKISWAVTLLIAIVIFYLSSLSLKGVENTGNLSSIYHFSIFFFLAFFLNISLTRGKKKYLVLFTGILLAVSYGILDEIHQFFVPGRACTIADFLVDSSGILFSSGAYLIWIMYHNHRNI